MRNNTDGCHIILGLLALCLLLAGCGPSRRGWSSRDDVAMDLYNQPVSRGTTSSRGGLVYLRAVRSSDGHSFEIATLTPPVGAELTQQNLAFVPEKAANMPSGGREYCAPQGEPIYVELSAFQKPGEPPPPAPAKSVPLGENESSVALNCDGTERHVVSIGIFVSAKIEGKAIRISLLLAFRPEGGAAPQPFNAQTERIDIEAGQAAVVFSRWVDYGLGGIMLSPTSKTPSDRLWLLLERLP
jgi:hypothetical protein